MNSNAKKPDNVGKNQATVETNVPRPAAMDRRQFLKWMGLVGAVAVVGAGAGLRGISNALTTSALEQASAETVVVAETSATPAAATQSTTAATENTTAATQSTAATTCVVRCKNGCSYPGHCKRYTDSDGNNRCDYGECM